MKLLKRWHVHLEIKAHTGSGGWAWVDAGPMSRHFTYAGAAEACFARRAASSAQSTRAQYRVKRCRKLTCG